MEPYLFFPMGRRTGIEDGGQFHSLRRTRWTMTLRVPSLEASGSVAIKLQKAPNADDEDAWDTLYDFGTISVEGTTVVRSFVVGEDAADFSMEVSDLWLRGVISANTGDYVVELTGSSRFLDLAVQSQIELLTAGLRLSTETRQRLVDNAERDIVNWLQRGSDTSDGTLMVNTDDVGALELIQQAIVVHADYLQLKEVLRDTGKTEDRIESAKMVGIAPGAKDIMGPVVLLSGRVWRGR